MRSREGIEERWVSVTDSVTWRRLARSGPGSRLLASRSYRAVDTARRFAATSIQTARHRERFRDVETLCVFIGHAKSGGTLLGALLDAHPDVVLADEIDVLRYVAAGFRRDQIFHLLVKGSRREAQKGRVTARRLDPYSFAVPGQWQGRHRELRVIGESRAGPTTRRLGREPDLLPRLSQRMDGVRPRFIHVVRHPMDPIAAMVRRGRRTFDDAISDYGRQSRTLLELRRRIDPGDLLTVRYERFVREPVESLRASCTFLGLEPEEGYVNACAAIIDPSFRRERDTVEWQEGHLERVRALISRTPFLDGFEPDAHENGA